MVAWASQFDDRNKAHFNGRSDLRSNERFQTLAAWGPNPRQIEEHFPEILSPGVRFTETPWSDLGATAMGQFACFWVWDPEHPDYGVWAVAATDGVSAQDATNKQAPVVYGWYHPIAKRLPSYQQMRSSGLPWQNGFFEEYLKKHPNEDPERRRREQALPNDFVTFEVVGVIDGQPVPLTDIVRHVGGSDYELAAGAQIAVTDSPSDGYNLAGSPGKWPDVYGSQSPAQFGLDRNKGVLFYNGATAHPQVLPAKVLSDWYGPAWRREIYGGR